MNEKENKDEKSREERYKKYAILAVLIGFLVYVIIDYTVPGLGYIQDILLEFLKWVEDHPWEGVFAVAGVYTLATILFIPGSILTIGAGLVFGRALGIALGILMGSIAVFTGASIGATCAFFLGRYVLQENAQELFRKYPLMVAIDRAIQERGLVIVLLLRLSPLVPFTALNYVMGVTQVKPVDYIVGCIGMIPGTVAYVFIGTSASGLLSGGSSSGGNKTSDTVTLIIWILGSIITLATVIWISYYSKKLLREILGDEEGGDDHQDGDEEKQEVAGEVAFK